ncbi:MAG: class I SAM-dependent methyltransferase [Patescibacteria group bacterium]
MNVTSPLTGSSNVIREREVPTDFIIKEYQKQLGVDVRRFFAGLDKVVLYRCEDSGYRFYHPFTVTGDSAFYETLQQHPWYYMDEKWEHRKALESIANGQTVLEVGCAQGEFLTGLRNKGIDGTGLELNGHAASVGRKKGLNIAEESVQDHAQKNKEWYDVVCSFQVAEHIAAIGDFIRASLDALKPGGKFIISVPNNDSFVFTTRPDDLLNMPPHHVGLWNVNSLIKLQHFFPVRIEELYMEPLQSYHTAFARSVLETNFLNKLQKKHLAWLPFVRTIGKRMIFMNIHAIREHITGHTIMAIYAKH